MVKKLESFIVGKKMIKYNVRLFIILQFYLCVWLRI